MTTDRVHRHAGYGPATELLLLLLVALFSVQGTAGAAGQNGSGGAAHMPLGDCKCDNLAELVDRRYEVEAAMAALAQEAAVVRGTTTSEKPRTYVDATDRHLLEDDLQKAMDAVHDPGLPGRVKNMVFTSECDKSVQGPDVCLNAAANAGEAVYLALCQSQHSLNHNVAGWALGNSNWQERRSLAWLLDRARDAYAAELRYIDQQLDVLQDVCKTRNWSGKVVISYEERYGAHLPTPGTIQGSRSIDNRDLRDAIITVTDGKAVGELSAAISDKDNETKSGQTSCHGGGLTPKMVPFSSTTSTAIEKTGDFYSRPSFQLSFDPSGTYRISVAMKGGYGTGTSVYTYDYQGECGKSTPPAKTFLPKEFLDGVNVVGKGHGRKADLVLRGSDTPVNTSSGGVSRLVKIVWDLRRSGAN